eukprot:363371-Chlamydomonas_euryale.AAC.3
MAGRVAEANSHHEHIVLPSPKSETSAGKRTHQARHCSLLKWIQLEGVLLGSLAAVRRLLQGACSKHRVHQMYAFSLQSHVPHPQGCTERRRNSHAVSAAPKHGGVSGRCTRAFVRAPPHDAPCSMHPVCPRMAHAWRMHGACMAHAWRSAFRLTVHLWVKCDACWVKAVRHRHVVRRGRQLAIQRRPLGRRRRCLWYLGAAALAAYIAS